MSFHPAGQSVSTTAATNPSQRTLPLRQPAALVLLAVNGLSLLISVGRLIFVADNWGDTFTRRAEASFLAEIGGGFLGLFALAAPLLAVLLVTHITPQTALARPITIVAMVEYGVSALFGLLAAVAGCMYVLSDDFAPDGTEGVTRLAAETLLMRMGWLAVLGMAITVLWRVLASVPGMTSPRQAGYPQQQPGAYPGQTPYGYQQQAQQVPQAFTTAGGQATQATGYYQQQGYSAQHPGYAAQQQGYAATSQASAGAYPAAQPNPAAYQQQEQQQGWFPQTLSQQQPAAEPAGSSPFAAYTSAAPASTPPVSSAVPASTPPVSSAVPASTPPAIPGSGYTTPYNTTPGPAPAAGQWPGAGVSSPTPSPTPFGSPWTPSDPSVSGAGGPAAQAAADAGGLPEDEENQRTQFIHGYGDEPTQRYRNLP